ncbi:hypothetical protein [Adhaeribacter pallidiroseus]|uniref:Uncharacterized protein n=1 Tax=Adhaeribacter pallidiroseus TaxID=2072847 RepID=A0A369QGV0_9BACT|nr:hypothetical protein [Adhaeribacter pallidiroseus]RDC61508.1 hypothetical protein AHMF7616_00087 [Adhaeribacter pallidiroseus]
MDGNERLIESMSDVLIEIKDLKSEVKDIKTEIKGLRTETNNRFENLEKAVDKNTEGIIKLQLSNSELRLSNMHLAQEIERVLDLDRRLKIIENIVLHKAS